MEIYNLCKSDLEMIGEGTKMLVLATLVDDGLLEREVAERWNKNHPVMAREKSPFWQTTGRQEARLGSKGLARHFRRMLDALA